MANLAGRTLDLLIFQTPQVQGMTKVSLGLGDQPSACAGIQKLAQTFVSMLLNVDGSGGVNAPGTTFLSALRGGQINTDNDVRFYFGLAVSEILEYLNTRTKVMPNDETLRTAKLTKIVLTEGQLSLHITLESMAGDSRELLLPVRW